MGILNKDLITNFTTSSFSIYKETEDVSISFTTDNKHIIHDNELYITKGCPKLSSLSYDSVLIGGLGMGVIPEWIAQNTSCSVIDVVDNNSELTHWVSSSGHLDSTINIIDGDIYTYTPTRSYDLILIDIWFGGESDIIDNTYTTLETRYSGSINSGGHYYLPFLANPVTY